MSFLEVEITPKMRDWANKRYGYNKVGESQYFTTDLNTDTDPEFTGLLGEAIFWVTFQEAVRAPMKEAGYDFSLGGRKIEVKTHRRTVPPKENYYHLLKNRDVIRAQDIFVFINLHSSEKLGWVLGWLTADEVDKQAEYVKAGERQKDSNFVYKKDQRALSLSLIRPPTSLREIIESQENNGQFLR